MNATMPSVLKITGLTLCTMTCLMGIGQTTFKVCDVKPAKDLLEEKSFWEVVKDATQCNADEDQLPHRVLEDCVDRDYTLVPAYAHPFVYAVQRAYAGHRPLTISPDMIWLMITQGFAAHVDANAESLRDLFVDFEGKKMLNVQRDDFVKGSRDNDWEGVFPEFNDQIGYYTKSQVRGLLNQSFSTSTKVENAAFQITLMDAMSSYFDYSVTVMCGIPAITLEGTPEDWEKLELKTGELAAYDLEWWTKKLLPILQEFTLASKGKVNKRFWAKIYNEKNVEVDLVCATGMETHISGWILNFFPYVNGEKNPFLGKAAENSTLEMNTLPSGLSKADVLFDDNGSYYKLEFIAGFMGIRQDKNTKSLRPEIAWAVVDSGVAPSEELLKSYQQFQQREKTSVKTN